MMNGAYNVKLSFVFIIILIKWISYLCLSLRKNQNSRSVKKYIISTKLRMLHPRKSPADAPKATVIEHVYKLNYNTVCITAVRVRMQIEHMIDCGYGGH